MTHSHTEKYTFKHTYVRTHMLPLNANVSHPRMMCETCYVQMTPRGVSCHHKEQEPWRRAKGHSPLLLSVCNCYLSQCFFYHFVKLGEKKQQNKTKKQQNKTLLMQISSSCQRKDSHTASPQSSAFSLTNVRRQFVLPFHLFFFFFNKVGSFTINHGVGCSKNIWHVDLLSLLLQIN